MILNINLNGATNLVANLPTDKMAYVESVVKFFEQNVVAVKEDYSEVGVVELTPTITLGDSVKFLSNSNRYSSTESTGNDLVVSGAGSELIEGFEPMTPELSVSNKRLMNKLRKEIKKLEEDKKMLEVKVERLQEELDNKTEG